MVVRKVGTSTARTFKGKVVRNSIVFTYYQGSKTYILQSFRADGPLYANENNLRDTNDILVDKLHVHNLFASLVQFDSTLSRGTVVSTCNLFYP